VLLWPTVTLLGFVALATLVIALGTSSTARYERERAAVRRQQESGTGGPPRTTHPAGRVARIPAPAWWLVDESGTTVVAGPFADAIEADWVALAGQLPDPVRAAYGVPGPDGCLVPRQLPQEREWLAHLSSQLDLLGEAWDGVSSDGDALTTLLVEVTAALVEAGLPLHDRSSSSGGVCLEPAPDGGGVLVSWRQHDRMSVEQVRGAAVDAAVQRTMTAAVADVLTQMAFEVSQFGATGCLLVTAQRSALAA
jgi:hypothetical protein